METALITGVTGQDGSYLSKFLLDKGYIVYGLARRSSVNNLMRIGGLFSNPNFHICSGDMTDHISLTKVIAEIEPDEIYNLAAQSHVKVSFDQPLYTAEVDALGAVRILESLRMLGLEDTRVYQASTSELFGMVQSTPQNEKTPFYPRSPYSAAKLYAYWMMVNYREAYGMFTSNGIMFNHESPLRGEDFVTRKITLAATRIKYGFQDILKLGNLDAKRDWGYAKDYVEAMWQTLQQKDADDFVIATGEAHTVREFVEFAFNELGMEIEWEGKGDKEKGYIAGTATKTIEVDPAFYRPTEVNALIGDATKAKNVLGWKPKTSLRELVKIMVHADEEYILHPEQNILT